MFFVLSKTLGVLAMPSTWLVLATCLALGLGVAKKAWPSFCTVLATVYAVLLILPIGDWTLGSLEVQVPTLPLPPRVDGMVVLGGAIDTVLTDEQGSVALNDAAERLTVMQELHARFPAARIVFTGGSGRLSDRPHREADDAKTLFGQWHLPIDTIIFERESRNTFENAVFSKRLAIPKTGENWLLITSAAHMARARAIFAKVDWPIIPYKVDYRAEMRPALLCLCFAGNLQKLDQTAHEWLGLIVYNMTGKS